MDSASQADRRADVRDDAAVRPESDGSEKAPPEQGSPRPPPPPETEDLELSPDWRGWIAENLARGVSRHRVLQILGEHGVSEPEGRRRVAEVEASPIYQATRTLGRRLTQLEQIVRLMAVHRRAPEQAATVPSMPSLSPSEFFEVYWASNTPVILTDVVTQWPAFTRWSPEYFRDRVGHVEIEMSSDRASDPDWDANFSSHRQSILMRDYVDRVLAAGESNDFYLIARGRNMELEGLQILFEDVTGPESILDTRNLRGGSALWFGPAGTLTSLHHDTSNILFCQVYGRKRVRIAAPTETALLKTGRGLYNSLDLDGIDPQDRPDLLVKTIELAPGEALFIPAGWWHTVRALDVSISLAINRFVRPNAFPWYRPGSVR